MELVDPPPSGRTYTGERTVSIADAGPDGRMRFDAILRFLGDIGNDDTDEAGLGMLGLVWVLRRSSMLIKQHATTRERLTMTTWCSGTGKRWAERRTSIVGDQGARIEAAALWIHIDPETGAPVPWGDEFRELYLEAAGGRTVDSRLRLPKHPPTPGADGVNTMPWRFRRTDHDLMDHVNNAAWAAVLEEALGGAPLPSPLRFEIDWHKPATCTEDLLAIETFDEAGATLWLVAADDHDDLRCVLRGGPHT